MSIIGGIALGLAAGALALLVLALQRRFRRVARFFRVVLAIYAISALGLVAVEGYFRYFYADPDGRLASENWIRLYWHENALGYRDREWQPEDWQGKTTVAVIGDSYATGWGIEDPADRFSDVLSSRLGNDYAVLNLAQAGANTPQELANLQAHPAAPFDVVILQYFLDDIDYTLLEMGLPLPRLEIPQLARESYLASYLYFRSQAGFGSEFWRIQYEAYDNFAIWDTHRAEIEAIIDDVESTGAQLIVVIFPNMQDPVASIPYVDRVAQVFEARGYGDRVIKLYDAVAAWPEQYGTDAFISQRNPHPTVEFNHWLGQMLYDRFFTS